MKHTHNPDNRTEKEEIISTKINKTKHNIEVSNEMVDKTDDDKTIRNLADKNNKRKEAINHLNQEIKDKSTDKRF